MGTSSRPVLHVYMVGTGQAGISISSTRPTCMYHACLLAELRLPLKESLSTPSSTSYIILLQQQAKPMGDVTMQHATTAPVCPWGGSGWPLALGWGGQQWPLLLLRLRRLHVPPHNFKFLTGGVDPTAALFLTFYGRHGTPRSNRFYTDPQPSQGCPCP